ncbi:sigma-70 family RNA polymerase sigma factor [Sphingosinicellaceae bacterium]|nr:sigma-70 family RNA polymerase sigma factor [Sphingosinicellaceae bacterium]
MLDRTASGDLPAFRGLYDATSAKLFGVILRILHERGEAEDVLQEVYTIVWRKAAEFDATRASPVTWMATIARNRAIDRLRARGSRPTVPIDAAAEVRDERPGADDLLSASDEARRLNAALGKLDARHAAAIRSTYFDGLTYEALAVREGVPVGTLKSWVRRGLIRMKGELA